jgi:hypothetical protein
MNDLMFFNTPAVADVSGDGNAEVLQSSAMYDMRAYGAPLVPAPLGVASVPDGWPKFTGGWSVVTPAVGDLDGDGKLDLASLTREGDLFVWKTAGDACQTAEWPKYQHDLRNTGDYRTDGKRPGVLRDVRLEGSTLHFTTSGSDGRCGRADAFLVTVNGVVIDVTALPGAPGTSTSISLPALGPGAVVTVQATDEAGNLSIPVRVLAAGAVAPAPAGGNESRGVLPTTGAYDLTGLLLLAVALSLVVVRRRATAR